MVLNLDPMYIINLFLCIVIFVLGYVGYTKKNKMPLHIGIAFGLFGISHLTTILGYKADFDVFLIIIRTIAYLLVACALYKVAYKK